MPCLSTAGWAGEPEYIRWIKWEQRPIFYRDPDTGKLSGIYQNIIDFLHRTPPLDRYQQKQVMVNHVRFNRVARSSDNCYLGWSTFPEQRVDSKPITIIRPWVLWSNTENQDKLGPVSQLLSLEALIQDPDIKVGVIRDFSYSKPVLELLKKYNNNTTIFRANTSAIEINPRTLDTGRVDVFLGNPGQMQRPRNSPAPRGSYISYGILEDNQYRLMLVSCANDKKGKEVIRKINQLIDSMGSDFYNKILSFHDDWEGELNPTFIEQFRRLVFPVSN